MSTSRSRRWILVLILLLLALVLVLLARCGDPEKNAAAPTPATPAPAREAAPATTTVPSPKSKDASAESLSSATVQTVAEVPAGAIFQVQWTGPNNPEDYVTIATPESPEPAYASYALTSVGPRLEMTAPITPGLFEVRYVAARSRRVLGKTTVKVLPIAATLTAPERAPLGTVVSISWTGPANAGDFLTIVPKEFPDNKSANYTYTTKGSPTNVLAPATAGSAEVRYVTGQGHQVIGRRAIELVEPDITLTADPEVVAGALLPITWTGPKNSEDYITIVAKDLPDGRYGNYALTSVGSPLPVAAPLDPGAAEIRYMTRQGNKVLARRAVTVVPAKVTLSADPDVVAGSDLSVTWTGPNNSGDYLTLVMKDTPDGGYGNNTQASSGSPLKILVPIVEGEAEIRYMTGVGGRVLGRRAIKILPVKIAMEAPDRVAPGAEVPITFTGSQNRGDYITIVAKQASDGEYGQYAAVGSTPSVKIVAPKEPGEAEIRYMSGQGRHVLARRPITVAAP